MFRRLLLPIVALLLLWPALTTTTPTAPLSLPQASSNQGEGSGPARHRFRPATLPADLALSVAASKVIIQADTCADGILAHDEIGGAANVALANIQVQLWDQDNNSADDLLDADLTVASGAFLLCSATEDLDDTVNDGLDLFVRVVTENGFWRVHDAEAYQFSLPVVPNMPAGTTHHYGPVKPGQGTPQAGALQIFNAVHHLWGWTAAQHANDCWDALDHQLNDYSKCRQVAIEWQPDSTASAFYDSALNRVHLGAVDFKWRDSVVREAAKSVMDDLFEDDYPDTQACGEHTSIGKQTTVGCAWAEGFADWVATQVFADPMLDWQVGTQIFHENLEAASWETAGWDDGIAVEGRVAGALLDLSDATNDGPWDRIAEGPNLIWAKLLSHSWDPQKRFQDFGGYWIHRTGKQCGLLPQLGGDNALATLYQNTIDCGLRDPLTNGLTIVRPTPVPPHHFRYTTTTHYWSVMAIRPPQSSAPAADYDLKLFANEALSGTPLTTSTAGGSSADFVVIDSNANKQPFATFYPQSYRFGSNAGSGQYDIRFVQASGNVGIGQSVSTSAIPVAIWETTVAASAQVKIEVTQPPGQDAELFFYCSTTTPSTWVRNRFSASAMAPALPAGTETLLWTAPVTTPGYCAIVLINKSGGGTFTVTRKS